MTDPTRKRELALIHMAKATLGLSRDDYEHVLRAVTAKLKWAGHSLPLMGESAKLLCSERCRRAL